MKLKCLVMLGDFFIQTIEEDEVKTSMNAKQIPVLFIKPKSVKMTFQVLPFLVFHLL